MWLDDILCSAVSPSSVNLAIDRIQALLRQRHHIGPDQEDDFNIRRPDEVLNTIIDFLPAWAALAMLVYAPTCDMHPTFALCLRMMLASGGVPTHGDERAICDD